MGRVGMARVSNAWSTQEQPNTKTVFLCEKCIAFEINIWNKQWQLKKRYFWHAAVQDAGGAAVYSCSTQ